MKVVPVTFVLRMYCVMPRETSLIHTSYFTAPGRTSQLIVGRSVGWNLVIPCKTVAVLITNVYFGVQGPIVSLFFARTQRLNFPIPKSTGGVYEVWVTVAP